MADRLTVEGHHPLMEIVARKLFGIEGVPRDEQRKMCSRAAVAALEWHKADRATLEDENNRFRGLLRGCAPYFGYAMYELLRRIEEDPGNNDYDGLVVDLIDLEGQINDITEV